jgi:hypothetical protein
MEEEEEEVVEAGCSGREEMGPSTSKDPGLFRRIRCARRAEREKKRKKKEEEEETRSRGQPWAGYKGDQIHPVCFQNGVEFRVGVIRFWGSSV